MSFFIRLKEKYRVHTCVDVHSTLFTGLFYFSPTYQILEIVYQLHKTFLNVIVGVIPQVIGATVPLSHQALNFFFQDLY